MSHRLQVYLFGAKPESTAANIISDSVTIIDEENCLTSATSESLNRVVEQATADFLGFVDSNIQVSSSDFNQVLATLNAQSNAGAALIPVTDSGREDHCWRMFPSRLASLIAAPEQNAVFVFRRTELQKTDPFRNVSRPFWERLVRAARDGMPLIVSENNLPRMTNPDEQSELPALVPKVPARDKQWLCDELMNVRPEDLISRIGSQVDALAVKSGLLLMHDFLDESHRLSQSIEGQGIHHSADYWHGLMHRREPDYGNSKYWFRRVGRHPVFEVLSKRAAAILDECNSNAATNWRQQLGSPNDWDPFAFVDLCESCEQSGEDPLSLAARRIQLEEMRLLLMATYQDATN